jgi:hypothetical protein
MSDQDPPPAVTSEDIANLLASLGQLSNAMAAQATASTAALAEAERRFAATDQLLQDLYIELNNSLTETESNEIFYIIETDPTGTTARHTNMITHYVPDLTAQHVIDNTTQLIQRVQASGAVSADAILRTVLNDMVFTTYKILNLIGSTPRIPWSQRQPVCPALASYHRSSNRTRCRCLRWSESLQTGAQDCQARRLHLRCPLIQTRASNC